MSSTHVKLVISLHCAHCVCLHVDAVRQNPLTKDARDCDIDRVIKDWLRTASTRSGAPSLRLDSSQRQPDNSHVDSGVARL